MSLRPRTLSPAAAALLPILAATTACGLEAAYAAFTNSTTGGSSGGESTGDGASSTGGASSGEPSTTGSASEGDEGTTGSGTTGVGPSDTGTSGPVPYCGDGVVDPDEECDDGNLDSSDACNVVCARQRVVFATSELLTPELIGSLHLADGICRQLAGKSDLPNWKTYTAWLSDSTRSAAERIYFGKGRYVRPDGVLVAHDAEQFLSGELEAPINIDEWGGLVEGSAWTGTLPDGSAVPNADHCNDWSEDNLSLWGHYGHVGSTDPSWTYEPNPEFNPIPCFDDKALYCIEGK